MARDPEAGAAGPALGRMPKKKKPTEDTRGATEPPAPVRVHTSQGMREIRADVHERFQRIVARVEASVEVPRRSRSRTMPLPNTNRPKGALPTGEDEE